VLGAVTVMIGKVAITNIVIIASAFFTMAWPEFLLRLQGLFLKNDTGGSINDHFFLNEQG
jgi:hypothetical protein